MKELNLPAYSFKIKRNEKGQNLIFDRARKKFVVLTPEEWVRQHFVRYMIDEMGYPEGLIGVEVEFKLNELTRRADILVYDKSGNPVLIVECKSPDVKINNIAFDQIVAYNIRFRLDYIIITNGLEHYACFTDWKKGSYSFLKKIPQFSEIF